MPESFAYWAFRLRGVIAVFNLVVVATAVRAAFSLRALSLKLLFVGSFVWFGKCVGTVVVSTFLTFALLSITILLVTLSYESMYRHVLFVWIA